MTRIITQPYEHAQAHSHTQSWLIPPPSPEHAQPSSRSSSFYNMTTHSRSRTSSPDVYSSVRFASSHHSLQHNGAGMHTTILNALRRSHSHHAQLIGDTDPEAPTYIDPSELYEPPPLPKLEGEEMEDEVQDQ